MILNVLPLCLITSLFSFYTTFIRHVSCDENFNSSYVQVVDDDIIKSANDQSHYRYIQLTNQMKVLLVGNKTGERSSVSLNINVGYMNNPIHNPYLVNLLDRIFTSFMTEFSDDYKRAGFRQLVWDDNIKADRMGSTFSFATSYLPTFLKRLAEFLNVPQFSLDLVQKAVEQLNRDLKSDLYNRIIQWEAVLRSLSNRSHEFYAPLMPSTPLSADAKTFNEIRNELVNFHYQYFSANLMTLVVTGSSSIKHLMTMIVPLFGPIANKQLKIPTWSNHPFGPEQTGYYYQVKMWPNSEERDLFVMLFPIPDFSAYFRSKPWFYVTRLLSKKGEKYFLTNQQTTALIDSLSFEAKVERTSNRFGFFTIACRLTDKGQENVPAVLKLFLDYINFLKYENVQKWIMDEIQRELQIYFNHQIEEKDEIAYAKDLASALSNPLIPPKYYMYEKYVMDEYNPELIWEFLSYLTMDNMNIFVWTKRVNDKSGQKMKWFDKLCYAKKLSEVLENSNRTISTNFSFPKPNLYLPSNFDIVKADDNENSTVPRIIFESDQGRIWYLKDNLFMLPRLRVYFKLVSPVVSHSVSSKAVATLYGDMIRSSLTDYYSNDLLNEKSLEMSINFSQTYSGYIIQFNGYSDKMLTFIRDMFNRILKFEVSQSYFVRSKRSFIERLEKMHQDSYDMLTEAYADLLLTSKGFASTELLHHVKGVRIESMVHFKHEFFSRLFTELLVYGNADKQGAKEIFNSVQNIIKENFPNGSHVHKMEIEKPRTVVLPEGKHYFFATKLYGKNKGDKSVIRQVFQTGPTDNIRNIAMNALVSGMIHQFVGHDYHYKITRNHKYHGTNAIEILYVDRGKPEELVSEIEYRIKEFEKWVFMLPDWEFEYIKEKIMWPPKVMFSTFDIAHAYWKEIEDEYFFNRSQTSAKAAGNITKYEVVSFIKEKLLPDSPKRRMLTIYAYPENQSKNVIFIRDITAFKKGLPLYSLQSLFANTLHSKYRIESIHLLEGKSRR